MNNIQTIVFLTLKDVGIEERGGGERIRTSDDVAAILVFKTSPIDHSGTPPFS